MTRLFGLPGLLAALMPMLAAGQDPAPPPLQSPPPRVVDAASAPLSAELVKTGLYLIPGGGSNSLLRLSASGSILVDGKRSGAYRPLMTQVRRISRLSDLPARVLIVTDHHAHHTGNHAQFLAAGIVVLAQRNAEGRLPPAEATATATATATASATATATSTPTPTPVAGAPSSARPPAPTITFDRDYTLRMGGVEVHAHHFGSGHTDNDAVVHFPDLKVVAVGDLLGPDAPVPDFAAGGSLVGWAAALRQVLRLDFEIVVPSIGRPATRADLVAYQAKVDTLVSRASALVSQGVVKDQLLARLKTDDLGWRLSLTGEQLDGLYADLAAGR